MVYTFLENLEIGNNNVLFVCLLTGVAVRCKTGSWISMNIRCISHWRTKKKPTNHDISRLNILRTNLRYEKTLILLRLEL